MIGLTYDPFIQPQELIAGEFIACITPSKKTIGTGGVWDMWRHIEMVLGKTPSTDAFLAEVRAQGVEMFAEVLKNSGAAYQREFYADTGNAYIEASKDAVEFAAQIRKGVQS